MTSGRTSKPDRIAAENRVADLVGAGMIWIFKQLHRSIGLAVFSLSPGPVGKSSPVARFINASRTGCPVVVAMIQIAGAQPLPGRLEGSGGIKGSQSTF